MQTDILREQNCPRTTGRTPWGSWMCPAKNQKSLGRSCKIHQYRKMIKMACMENITKAKEFGEKKTQPNPAAQSHCLPGMQARTDTQHITTAHNKQVRS